MADVRLTATNPEDSSVVPVACDASGRLLLEEQGQGPQGEQGPQGPKGDDGDPFSGNFADDVTFGGSASFADEIKVEGSNTPSGKWRGISKYGSLLIGTTSEAVSDATVSIDSSSGLLKSDGSAQFAGEVSADGSAKFATRRIALNSNGSIDTYRSSGDANSDLQAWQSDIGGIKQVKARIKASGSAEFAGDKAGFTAEGYLWCTTVRGDTVMLDATSNGMGVWVEYSPTTRIDEIRDKLDANRGDTGEMPADAP